MCAKKLMVLLAFLTIFIVSCPINDPVFPLGPNDIPVVPNAPSEPTEDLEEGYFLQTDIDNWKTVLTSLLKEDGSEKEGKVVEEKSFMKASADYTREVVIGGNEETKINVRYKEGSYYKEDNQGSEAIIVGQYIDDGNKSFRLNIEMDKDMSLKSGHYYENNDEITINWSLFGGSEIQKGSIEEKVFSIFGEFCAYGPDNIDGTIVETVITYTDYSENSINGKTTIITEATDKNTSKNYYRTDKDKPIKLTIGADNLVVRYEIDTIVENQGGKETVQDGSYIHVKKGDSEKFKSFPLSEINFGTNAGSDTPIPEQPKLLKISDDESYWYKNGVWYNNEDCTGGKVQTVKSVEPKIINFTVKFGGGIAKEGQTGDEYFKNDTPISLAFENYVKKGTDEKVIGSDFALPYGKTLFLNEDTIEVEQKYETKTLIFPDLITSDSNSKAYFSNYSPDGPRPYPYSDTKKRKVPNGQKY